MTVAGGIVGFLLKWALPSTRRVASGEVSRLEKQLQADLLALEAAKKTPALDDDVAAEKQIEATRQVLHTRQLLRDALDGLPV